MNGFYYNNAIHIGRLVYLSHITDASLLKGSIVFIDCKPRFYLDELSVNKPSCILVENAVLFSHIVSYCISIGVAVAAVKKEELASLEGCDICLNLYTGEVNTNIDSLSMPIHKQNQMYHGDINTVYTKDGTAINLLATVKTIENAIQANKLGVNNAGLVCTEYLYSAVLGYDFNEALNDICDQFCNGVSFIRLYDYDDSKQFSSNISFTNAARGIRATFDSNYMKMIRNQLSCIIGISKRRSVCVVVPYVSSVDDIVTIDRMIKEENAGVPLPISAMIETPSSFFSIPQISQYVSSISIGTNDLSASFFACDRSSVFEPSFYYNPYDWGFISMLSCCPIHCVNEVRVCGQLPMYPLMLEVLISLGFNSFSIPTPMLNTMAKRIQSINTVPKETLLHNIADCNRAPKMVKRLSELFHTHVVG